MPSLGRLCKTEGINVCEKMSLRHGPLWNLYIRERSVTIKSEGRRRMVSLPIASSGRLDALQPNGCLAPVVLDTVYSTVVHGEVRQKPKHMCDF